MARLLFKQIVNAVTNRDAYFHSNVDCTGREGISLLIRCTFSIRQLTYGVNASFLDEYMQMSKRSSCTALDHFCQAVMEIYGPEYLRKPTVTDIEKLYRHHEEKHGFPRMLRSLDCKDWEWFGFSYSFKGQYVRRDHVAISPKWSPDEAHQPEDMLQNEEQVEQVMREDGDFKFLVDSGGICSISLIED
nr:hypothetical protein [Tanacetum cinerariifolium]